MIQKLNTLAKVPVALLIAVGIMFLQFGSASTLNEALAAQNEEHQWGYAQDNGPSRWGGLSSEWVMCAEGKDQSPIDLRDARQIKAEEKKGQFPSASLKIAYQEHVLDVVNNGHTIQVNYDGGETFKIGDESYALKQYHFHSPSEHTVNGRHYPMEMHLVHMSKDKKLAVIGVFIEEGRKNDAFETVWSNLPQKPGQKVRHESVGVDISDMLPKNKTTYRYNGSLTTPPCSESVRWFVYTEPIQMSGDQIKAFQKIFRGNNRPPQPLNDRKLLYDKVGEIKK